MSSALVVAAVRRLVVLVPAGQVDQVELAAQVLALSAARGLEVVLIGRTLDPRDAWAVRRELVTLAALIRNPTGVPAEIRVISRAPWTDLLAPLVQPGDLLVCQREQVVAGAWPWQRLSLAAALRRTLRVPVCTLEGIVLEREPSSERTLLTRLIGWVVPGLVIVGFTAMQIQIEMHSVGWLTTVLLCLSVLVEIAILSWCTR